MKVALIGFGTVGQGFAEILRDKATQLREDYGFVPEIVAVATRSRGTLYHREGLDPAGLLAAMQQGHLSHYPAVGSLRRDWEAMRIVRESEADVVIEASPTNLQTGQPAINLCYAAFESGKHVVLANKGPVALAYDELLEAAEGAGKLLLFEATVMAGTPVLRVGLQALAGCHIREVRGILNGTTNYILTEMESGLPYEEALAQAQALGYAEADPSADVDGWDAAGKALILATTLFGSHLKLHDFNVAGIGKITSEAIDKALSENKRWKLIAKATPNGGTIQPVALPLSDPLASVNGTTNAITFVTDVLGQVTVIGPGAGRLETGFALLSDLLDIFRTTY
jgi:homoserine dehydrogenase